MLNDLKLLWSLREKPRSASRLFIVWAKRLITFPALLKILTRIQLLRLRGAQIGRLVVIGQAKFEGNLKYLKVGNGVSIGKCIITLHENVEIFDNSVISDGAVLLTASHKLRDHYWGGECKSLRFDKYSWVAVNSIILPGVSLGCGAVVGAGAVVRCNVPDYSLAIGNPAVIVNNKRVNELKYSPSLLNAPLEAWVGPTKFIC
ncbi:MAG: acyltransferase [Betaproteobacteria bacterium]|nr:acyltransferase [Candidatus Dechloromonas phosphorivorans]